MRRQARAERVRHHVVGVADEQRPVAQAGEPRPLGQHLGVVVGGERGLPVPAVGHRQPARRSRSARRTGPACARGSRAGSSPPPRPRRRSRRRTARRRPGRRRRGSSRPGSRPSRRSPWNACRSCSPATLSQWAGLAGQPGRGRMHPLAAPVQHRGDRVLGQPVDLQVRAQPAQLVGDGQVAPGVAEPDRRGEEQRPPGPVQRSGPPSRRLPDAASGRVPTTGEVADPAVDRDRRAGPAAGGRHPPL